MSVTDAQIAEWKVNPHAGEHPAVVPALIAEIERLREQLRPLDGSEYAVVMGTRTFEERILERDALRAEIEKLRSAERTKMVVPLTDERLASARRLCNGIDGDENDWLEACLITLPLLLDEIDRLRFYEKTAAAESARILNELNEARAEIERLTKERDAWEARSREQARMLADNFGKFDR